MNLGTRNKLLWIQGVKNGNITLVDLAAPAEGNCDLEKYPNEVAYQSSIGFLDHNGLVVSCGGWNPDYSPFPGVTRECHTFDGSSWSELRQTHERFCVLFTYTQSVYVEGLGWWMWGPEETILGDCTDSMVSELLTLEGDWIDGPESPYGEYIPNEVCAVQLNETHTMLMGGWYNYLQLGDVWFYDWRTSEWMSGPPMLSERTYHSCAVDENGMVIVVGGTGRNNTDLWSVEVFDPLTMEWTESAPIPDDIEAPYWTRLVHSGDTSFLLEHGSPAIWSRSSDDGAWSPLQGANLGAKGFDGMDDRVILVPEDFAPGC